MAGPVQLSAANHAHDELFAALRCLLTPELQRVDGNASAVEAHHLGETSYFVLKAETRASIEDSLAQSKWATKSRASCVSLSGSQPHERLAAARQISRVVFLFALRSEGAWIGHATLESDAYFDPQEEWPYVFSISWRACLPHAKGVTFGELLGADAHRVFNCDEIPCCMGEMIRAAIDAKLDCLKLAEDEARHALCESCFLTIMPDECEREFHERLLHQVEVRLGPVVIACLCGSRRYNLDLPGSDRDLLVIYTAEDPGDFPALVKNPPLTRPDYTIVEVGKFTEMLLDGDPCMVETLFLNGNPTLLRATPLWTYLEDMRRKFLSRRLVHKYLSDATGRAGLAAVRKGTKASRHRKILYIAFRLLANALQAARGEDLQVWRRTSSLEHDMIMGLRRGDSTVALMLEEAEVLAAEVQSALAAAAVDSLPETPAPETLAKLQLWLQDVAAWRSGKMS